MAIFCLLKLLNYGQFPNQCVFLTGSHYAFEPSWNISLDSYLPLCDLLLSQIYRYAFILRNCCIDMFFLIHFNIRCWMFVCIRCWMRVCHEVQWLSDENIYKVKLKLYTLMHFSCSFYKAAESQKDFDNQFRAPCITPFMNTSASWVNYDHAGGGTVTSIVNLDIHLTATVSLPKRKSSQKEYWTTMVLATILPLR